MGGVLSILLYWWVDSLERRELLSQDVPSRETMTRSKACFAWLTDMAHDLDAQSHGLKSKVPGRCNPSDSLSLTCTAASNIRSTSSEYYSATGRSSWLAGQGRTIASCKSRIMRNPRSLEGLPTSSTSKFSVTG
ncbi:hypothetical protein QBC33DRAFT_198422 [Phialemonium atrogriseum]|uniref:Uncharacterized protein n=1 Tax=Phialemonium atrogriseum TaxID=1093897 RepID=A0AAJ0FII5_9PEZI|nr:uncharacterized protein QBC33DRAFT_198422 [Phialemonium atrogriseum]KAK1764413.1 hypothetical protein QBC33DRAFT_198422 [Phialemonium atrogriseum]